MEDQDGLTEGRGVMLVAAVIILVVAVVIVSASYHIGYNKDLHKKPEPYEIPGSSY
jgi:hypothetical protein